ncbi:MAG: hypothetical protein NVSMB9_11660 [Isosphaeraceae bacterium]
MTLLLNFTLFLFAQNAAPAAGGGGGQSPSFSSFLPFLAIGVLWFYLLLIRPQQKQEKMRRLMIDSLKKNDRVLTSSGIYGTIVSVDVEEDRVLVRIDDDRGVKVAFTTASITRVLDGTGNSTKSIKTREQAVEGG